MKNLKKIFFTVLLIFILFLLVDKSVFASTNQFQNNEYSEKFKEWLELPDEEKQNVLQPRMYDVLPTTTPSQNIFYKIRLLGASINSTYDLRNIIPANLKIKNQMDTQACWAFSALSSLETNLALYDYKQNGNVSNPKIYDFSERHMDYATSQTFKNNEKNDFGYNRQVEDGGNYLIAQSYLTNGTGAINEADMQFEDNMEPIDLSATQGKNVTSQVYDTIEFPNYNEYTGQKTEIMKQIKQHIKNYGSIFASIHGNSAESIVPCYNNTTGAIYCNNSYVHKTDHAVSIVGWDDNYSKTNFSQNAQPTSNGAWIIRNSWGEKLEYDLPKLKQEIYKLLQEEEKTGSYSSAEQIPDDFLKSLGYTIEGQKAYLKLGNNGFMYVSYEDCNIASQLWGITKATNSVNYENIYQYDEFAPGDAPFILDSNAMLANIFEKKTSGDEYLTQVSLYAPETYTCKVYVNPNGEELDAEHLTQVNLKAGETETFGVGYHTLEFAQPIKITGTKFAVVIGIQGTSDEVAIALECKPSDSQVLQNVTIQEGKCFIAGGDSLTSATWDDLSKLSQKDDELPNGDSTIKAFTTSNPDTKALQSIQVITPPTKTQYLIGEDFEKDGMKVQANYSDGTHTMLHDTDYIITNGTNLAEEQTSVTITYEGQTTTQKITVGNNNVTALTIETPPTKTEYIEGENFNPAGMVVKATYKDGTTKEVPQTDYTIEDGNNLDARQTTVTISYEGQSVTQAITVTQNPLLGISITKAPNKTEYIEGENFNPEGMIVTGTYQNGTTQTILDYTVENGTNLTKEQTSVTIKYKDKAATQAITVAVEEKAENSNLSNATSNVKKVKAYFYTNGTKKDYVLIDVEVNNISLNKSNDKVEYYYYLSPNANEEEIINWVKITEAQNDNNKLQFTIDSRKISNYSEISDEGVVYLYVKEVAIKGGDQSVEVSKSMKLETDKEVETYVNNVKKDTSQTNKPGTNGKDDTTAPGGIPDTGIAPAIIICITVLAVFCVISYIKYNKVKDAK